MIITITIIIYLLLFFIKKRRIKRLENNKDYFIKKINRSNHPYIINTADNGITLEIGNKKNPTIILLPGLFGNIITTIQSVYNLANNFYVIIIDLPGFISFEKKLENLNCRETLHFYSHYLDDKMKKLKIENKKFYLAGNSMGCMVSLMWMNISKYKKNCKKIILINPYNNLDFNPYLKFISKLNDNINMLTIFRHVVLGTMVNINNEDRLYWYNGISKNANNILRNMNNMPISLTELENTIDVPIFFIFGKYDYFFSLSKRINSKKRNYVILNNVFHILWHFDDVDTAPIIKKAVDGL